MASKKTLLKLIRRCQQSPSFFIDNFGKVKHPKLGIIPFKLFSYQRKALSEFKQNKYNIFKKCRQCGASTLTGAYALWYAMFFSNKSILIVSKRDEDAMEFLDRNVKFVYDQLPDWMKDIWKISKRNEHTLSLANGSTIRSLTSSPDTLRSNSGSLIIIDEAAFMQHMDTMWSGGWSCSEVSSLVSTDDGLISIGSLGDYSGQKWQDIDLQVATDDGNQQATKYYVNGFADTVKIKTRFGYEFEATKNHRIRVIDEDGDYVWRYMCDLQKGDLTVLQPDTHDGKRQFFDKRIEKNVPLLEGCKNGDKIKAECSCGSHVEIAFLSYKRNIRKYGNYKCLRCIHRSMSPQINDISELTPDLAEFVGYIVGDGSVSINRPKRIIINFNYNERDGVEKLKKKVDKLFGIESSIVESRDTLDLVIRSSRVVNFLHEHNLLSKTCASDAEIPPMILKSDRKVVYAFLRGLFNSDGWNYKTQGGSVHLGFGSSSKKLVDQVHQLLFSIGIICTRRLGINTTQRYSSESQYRLTVFDLYNKNKFQKLIGFNSSKKDWIVDKATKADKIKHIALANEFANYALDTVDSIDKRKWNLYAIRRNGRITRKFWEELTDDYPELQNTRLSDYFNKGFFFDEIESIERGSADTVDISVPENNTYIVNGFVSHNTIQTGGSVIIISTTNGIGNWYWKTWTDAINGDNSFNPININWWDMDWTIEFVDELSGEKTVISPCDDIKECQTDKDKEKYGPYWSPWLEDQYRQLSTKGSDHKFRQEILAEFMGTGNTVLGRAALLAIQDMVEETEQQVSNGELTIKTLGAVDYVHPVTQEMEVLQFQEELMVWKPPYTKQRAEKTVAAAKEHGFLDQLAPHDRRPHLYVIGADPSTGEADDFCALEVFDVDAHEQVAELRIKVLPKTFAKMIDYIGRWYNGAFVVCERTGIGHSTCVELDQELSYPNLYRHKRQTANLKTKYNQIGYPTSSSTKATLIKQLQDELGEDGYHIKSSRLYHELCIFIHLGKNRYGNEVGSGNTDDLVLATAFVLVGIEDALYKDNLTLTPVHSMEVSPELFDKVVVDSKLGDMVKTGGKSALMPFNVSSEMYSGKVNKEHELAKFTNQMGGIPIVKDNQIPGYATKDTVTFKKHILRYFRK